jgi:acetate kinase
MLVVALLGNGTSMCAIGHGSSLVNTMGFAAVELSIQA